MGSFDAFATWFAVKWVILYRVRQGDAARYEHAVFLYALGQLLRRIGWAVACEIDASITLCGHRNGGMFPGILIHGTWLVLVNLTQATAFIQVQQKK